MANEITEQGQQVVYGGPQVTLSGSSLGNTIGSLITREGSGSARAWKQYIPGRADYLNTKKILYPGDSVIIYPKSLPMDFPLQASGSVNKTPISWPAFTKNSAGPITTINGNTNVSDNYLPSFAFTSGSGTLQIQLNNTGMWQAPAVVTPGNTVKFRIQHSAPFSGVLTLTPQ